MFGIYIPDDTRPQQREDRPGLSGTEQSKNWSVMHSEEQMDKASKRRPMGCVLNEDVNIFEIRWNFVTKYLEF